MLRKYVRMLVYLTDFSYTLRKKVLPSTYFWCFSLSQKEDSIQYLEGPNGIWKHHDRQIGVQMDFFSFLSS